MVSPNDMGCMAIVEDVSHASRGRSVAVWLMMVVSVVAALVEDGFGSLQVAAGDRGSGGRSCGFVAAGNERVSLWLLEALID